MQTSLYEAFGGIEASWGNSKNNRLANTKERDASIALDNHGFRYYDASIGRYISNDPIGYEGGFNLYVHCTNDPVNKFDPLGLKGKAFKKVTDKILCKYLGKSDYKKYERLIKEGKLYQVHHILSKKLFGKDEKLSGFLDEMVDPEGAANKVVLPTKEGKKMDIPRGKNSPAATHQGGHVGEYYKQIQKDLNDIKRLFDAGKLSKEQTQAAIKDLQGRIRDGLKSGDIKLHRYDASIDEGELTAATATMGGLGMWAGMDIDEASDIASDALDDFTSNQTYYREKNQFAKYLTIGFYTHTSGNKYIQKAGEYADYLNPVQDTIDMTDLAVDVAAAARLGRNALVRQHQQRLQVLSMQNNKQGIRIVCISCKSSWRMIPMPLLCRIMLKRGF